MAEILIERCRLRLVRHGGWSWGPEPRALLQAAVRALPALLAAALADLFPEEDEREIAASVRLRLRIGRNEMLALAGLPMEEGPLPGSAAQALAARLGAALATSLGTAPALEPPGSPDPAVLQGGAENEAKSPEPLFSAFPLGRLLRSWRDHGGLAPRLALLSLPVLEAWRAALLREAQVAHRLHLAEEAGERLRQEAVTLASTLWTPDLAGEGSRAAALRAWLMAAVELAARHGIEPGHPAVVRGLADAMPAMAGSAPVVAWQDAPGRDPASTREPPVPPRVRMGMAALPASPDTVPEPSGDLDLHVASALPFLLLGPLSRTGYLETLAATFAAADLAGQLPLFAAALAYKVLPPPERGWRRSPAAARAAAAFAGLAEPAPESALTGLARRAAPCLEPLAADLTASLIAGHVPGRPLLLAAAGGGLLLAEVDGVFPIAWAAGLDGLRPALARLRDETLWVPAAAAAPGLLRGLDAVGCRFLCPAPPTRESWQPLRLPAGNRVWTNDQARPGLARQASGPLDAAEEGARRLWQALAVERCAAPLAADPCFDRHLTLAAAMALGTLAWTLWRDREPVDPVLTLERFGDLDARVRIRARSVHVLLPLGRRHLDLFQHRLLEPVRDAPWLGGRVLEYGGG